MRLLAALLLAAAPAAAQDPGTPLDAEAFGRLVEGRTLTYGAEDAEVPRGVETYESGRRVTWLEVATDECITGTWHGGGTPEAPQICFAYENGSKPCFLYFLREDGVTVVSTELDGSAPEVSFLDRDTDGIACAWLGV